MHIAHWLIGLLLGWALAAAPAVAAEDFLTPDQAFVIAAAAPDADTLRVSWRIAEGYYLYQSKIRFTTTTPGVTLGIPDLPPAEPKDDPIFGEVQIYRGNLQVDVPIERAPGAPDIISVQARSQGCADAGLCYPPRTQKVVVALPSLADGPLPVDPKMVAQMEQVVGAPTGSQPPSAAVSAAPEPTDEPAPMASADPAEAWLDAPDSASDEDLFGNFEDDILPAEEAFTLQTELLEGNLLALRWTIAPGTYLYRDQLQVESTTAQAVLAQREPPPGKLKQDSVKPDGSIGDVEVYYDAVEWRIPVINTAGEPLGATFQASFQGCADRGICYPPLRETFTVTLAKAGDDTAAEPVSAPPAATVTSTPAANQRVNATADAEPVAEQDRIAALLADGNLWLIVGSFFVIGLLLAFTPCVFPMIPILSGIIAGQGDRITTRKAFVLSLVYVLAMALTYTVAGVLAASLGENLQAALQNPIALSVFAGVFVLLALSMFGFYELQLPSGLQSRLADVSNRQSGGSLAGVAIMGLLSALIVGPCVAPPLAGALIYIGQTGDQLLGGLALFAMALGMGVPLIVIGTSAGKLLPRAGAWMDAVKAVFGVLMLGVAIYLLERVLPVEAVMLAWGLLLMASGVYMGATLPADGPVSGWRKLWRALGYALLLYGALFLIGAAAGGKDTLQPLRGLGQGLGLGGGAGAGVAELQFRKIKTGDDLNRELAAASAAGQPVMLDFYADWCVYCKMMEKNTFPAPEVRQALAGARLLKADVTANDEADRALQAHVGIPAPPAMIFWRADGTEARNYRLLGYKGPAEFADHVRQATQ